jgi:hypothetical protein
VREGCGEITEQHNLKTQFVAVFGVESSAAVDAWDAPFGSCATISSVLLCHPFGGN